MNRLRLHAAILLCIFVSTAASAQRGTLVTAIKQDAPAPVPYLGPGTTGNHDVMDQLFLRLATLGPRSVTVGDDALVPELARRWFRQDSVTVDFELDPRARWHDGMPVTSRDVVFAWQLIRTPSLGVNQASFELIESVSAVDGRVVRVRFRRPASEQVYVAGFQLQPLPAHLLGRIPADSLPTSAFIRSPVGNGPFRFVRRDPGVSIELAAVPDFFLGPPGLQRVVFRVVASPDAQVNLLLSGELDVMSDVPANALQRVQRLAAQRMVNAPGNFVTYLLFNSRSGDGSAAPHPVLGDQRVRQALALAIDRERLALTTFGPGVQTPGALRSQAWYWLGSSRVHHAGNLARARSLLAAAGWQVGSNGIRERDGVPLELTIIYPVQAATFAAIAVQVEQMWSRAGVRTVLEPVDGAVWFQRRRAGAFEVDIAGVNQDPSPSSLVQSWSCASAAQPGSGNVGRWCDAEFDRRLKSAETSDNPGAAFQRALDRMSEWQPAVVVGAPINRVSVHRRYDNVIVRPSRAWSALWQWRIRPGAELPRDR
ncbi:MAG TPA: peptide ABC transporter substrate-binding protein [Gemmatimonadales bacterium]|nr:peptide ABC transporter substrate-binding protein [Gemmatimonadales bacterium]